jgi:cell division septation protein DedD
MTSRRSNGRGWEIKLGPLQVVVWLGLAIGAIFGSYFIGFFSGRYVGFETARTASGVEVPKLALTEDFPDKPQKGWDNVYGKLGGSAVVGQDEKPEANAKPQVPDQRIAKAVQDSKREELAASDQSESPAVAKRDPLSDQDAIFTQDVGGTAAVIDESPSKEISGKGGEVRVLGREVDADSDKVEELAVAQRSVRDDPAKEVVAKKAPVITDEEAVPAKPKTPSETKAKEPVKEKVSVVKRLPKGYFAQVAAPKTRGEAEELSRRLKKSGFPVVIEDNSTGRSPFYRVMVGPEENKVQADRMLGQLKREKYLDGKLFVRQVK